MLATSQRTASTAASWLSSTEQTTSCATWKSFQERPASAAAWRTIRSALTVYSGEQTALSRTPSPIRPAIFKPVALVAGIHIGIFPRTGVQPSLQSSNSIVLPLKSTFAPVMISRIAVTQSSRAAGESPGGSP